MRTIFLFATLLFFITSQAQNHSLLNISHDSIGVNHQNNAVIKSKTYELPTSVYQFYFDSTSKNITFLLREKPEYNNTYKRKGFIGVFSTTSDSLHWIKQFDFKKTYIFQHYNYMLEQSKFGSSSINSLTGEKNWRGKTKIQYIDSKTAMGFGIRVDDNNRYRYYLDGVDLKTNTRLWSREVISKLDWEKLVYFDDGKIATKTAKEIRVTDLKTGEGWSREIKTIQSPSVGSVAAIAAASIIVGALTGVAVVPAANEVTGISSNILIHETNVYLAYGDSISCWDKNGQLLWTSGFPKKQCSKSSLFIKNNTLCMINLGYAYSQNQKVYQGKPFVAAFDFKTGKQHYLETPFVESSTIHDYNNQTDTISLLSYQQVIKFSVTNGVKIQDTKKDATLKSAYRYLINDPVYITSNGETYQPISNSDELLISTNDDKLVKTDWQGITMSVHPITTCYKLTYTLPSYSLIANDTNTILIDQNGKRIATLNMSYYAILRGTKLIEKVQNKLVTVDLAEFMR